MTCTLKINVATSEENANKQKAELNKPKETKKTKTIDADKSTKPEDTKKKIDSSNDDSKLVQKVENNKEDNLTPVNGKIEDNDSQQ